MLSGMVWAGGIVGSNGFFDYPIQKEIAVYDEDI
jgi:hypothetical protein